MDARGFTLLEVLIAATILGIVALAAVPALSTPEPYRLDAAASEVAEAVRFARTQALLTGEVYGVYASASGQRVRVYRLVPSGLLLAPEYSVRNPLDKKLYDLGFAGDGPYAGVRLTASSFQYRGQPLASEYLEFDGAGTPRWYDAGVVRALSSGSVTLGLGARQRTVQVEPVTGRVTVQ